MNSDTLKLGFVSLDGHGPEFARLINGPESKLEGASVVAAMPVPTVMISQQRLEENIAGTRDLGVEIVDTPEALAEKVDGILILHDDGSKHLELVRMFVDKSHAARFDGTDTCVNRGRETTAKAMSNRGKRNVLGGTLQDFMEGENP